MQRRIPSIITRSKRFAHQTPMQTPHRAAQSASKQLNKPQAPVETRGLFTRKSSGSSRRIPELYFAQSSVFIGGYFEEFPHCFRRPVMALFLLCEIKLYANDVSCKCWRAKREGKGCLLVSWFFRASGERQGRSVQASEEYGTGLPAPEVHLLRHLSLREVS